MSRKKSMAQVIKKILQVRMKAFIFLIQLIALLWIFIPEAGAGDNGTGDAVKSGGGAPVENYILKDGKVYRGEGLFSEIQVEGEVLGIFTAGELLYYIKEYNGIWYAGKYSEDREVSEEKPVGGGFTGLLRFSSDGNFFYFLAHLSGSRDEGETEELSVSGAKIFVRFDFGKDEKTVTEGIQDFILAGYRPALLTASGVEYDGNVIIVTLTGDRYIHRVIDSRLIFLTNGIETEVVDLLPGRNIYLYREGKAFPYSPDYNIILEFNDSAPATQRSADGEEMIYYHINLNGFEAGRTETAPPGVSKSSMLKAEDGKYCIIKAERWELDRTRGRYIRVNNIHQPEEIKVFVPENRIIKIIFDFNGEKYTLRQSVYEN